MTQPLVTVITPTFNRSAMLPEVIESVMAQTYSNIEYLLLDDGSSDDTRALVENLKERFHGRITYLHHENMGEARTVNRGWNEASGDYVMIINSDDPQPPMLVERTVAKLMDNPDAAVVYPDWTIIDEDGRDKIAIKLKEYRYEHMIEFLHCFIGPGALINRRLLFGSVPELRSPKYPYVSDLSSWLMLGRFGRFVHLPENIARWRQHDGATTQQKLDQMLIQRHHLVVDFFNSHEHSSSVLNVKDRSITRALLSGARGRILSQPLTAAALGMRALCRHPGIALAGIKRNYVVGLTNRLVRIWK